MLSFLSIQLIAVACTIGNLVHNYVYSFSEENSHHSHHGHNHNDHKNDKKPKGGEDENCCVENTAVFLTGIEAVPHDGKMQLDIPITINFCTNFSNEEVSYDTKLEAYQIRPPPLLFLSPASRRIFIQSFQI